ncbi:MAG TPA: hypothetical protein VHL11_16305, partial [Phototrophicaceae bacterium]|nr:hypothetical protein [Phototrophicaceae bacterium]
MPTLDHNSVPVSQQHIRRLEPDEADLLTDITLRSKAYWKYDDEFMRIVGPTMTIHSEAIRSSIYNGLEDAGRVVGFYSLEAPQDDQITLENLFI